MPSFVYLPYVLLREPNRQMYEQVTGKTKYLLLSVYGQASTKLRWLGENRELVALLVSEFTYN